MVVLNFDIQDYNFKKQIRKNIVVAVIAASIVFFIPYRYSNVNIEYCFGLMAFTFVVIIYQGYNNDKYYVTDILTDKKKVVIKYLENGVSKKAECEINKFKFKKKFANSHRRIPYLNLSGPNFIISQHRNGVWDEEKMDDTIQKLRGNSSN